MDKNWFERLSSEHFERVLVVGIVANLLFGVMLFRTGEIRAGRGETVRVALFGRGEVNVGEVAGVSDRDATRDEVRVGETVVRDEVPASVVNE